MSTSSFISFYKGYYAGDTPTVLSANPFDVAQDLSTGNLWQYTGAAWVAPAWQTAITFYLGAAETVCERLQSADTKIPEIIHVYYGTDDQVPPELGLSAEDLAIKHDIGSYTLFVNVIRQDVTTDTMVDVPFPEGYVVTTEDGNWTILKNFTQYVGFDQATVSISWCSNAEGLGVQDHGDFITSSGAQILIDETLSNGGYITSSGADVMISGALVNYPTSGAVLPIVAEGGYTTSGAVTDIVSSAMSGITLSGALMSGATIDTTVEDTNLQLTGGGFRVITNNGIERTISLQYGQDEATEYGYHGVSLDISGISLFSSKLDFGGEQPIYHTGNLQITNSAITASAENGSIDLQATYLLSDQETVASNTFNMSRDRIGMGCDDLDMGSWYADFNTQGISLVVNGNGVSVTGIGVSITGDFIASGITFPIGASLTATDVPDRLLIFNGEYIATQSWVTTQISGISAGITSADASSIASSVISSGGYVTSGGALVIASGAAQSAVSGAIFSNTEVDTTVGDYHLTYTSGGGLMISGGGVALQVSGGAIIASADNGNEDTPENVVFSVSSGGIVADVFRNMGAELGSKRIEITPDALIASGASGESMVMSGGSVVTKTDAISIVAAEENVQVYADTQGDLYVAGFAGVHMDLAENLTVNNRPVLVDSDLANYPSSGAVVPIVSNAGYITSGAVTAQISGALVGYTISGDIDPIASSAGYIKSAEARQLTSDVITSGGYATSTNVSSIAGEVISNSGYATSGAVLDIVSGASYTTEDWVSARVESAGEIDGYITSGEADNIASSAVSGAIFSNTAINTSDGSAQFVLSSGAIVGGNLTEDDNYVHITDEGIDIHASAGGSVTLAGTPLMLSGAIITANGRNVLTEMPTVIDSTNTSVTLPVASGGTSYIFTQPLTSLAITNVISSVNEDRLQFTLAVGGQVTVPLSCGFAPPDFVFEAGKSYLMAILGGNIVAGEYTLGQ